MLLNNSASFTSSMMRDLCQKWKVNLSIFQGAWNSLMAWPDWPRPRILRFWLSEFFISQFATSQGGNNIRSTNNTWLAMGRYNASKLAVVRLWWMKLYSQWFMDCTRVCRGLDRKRGLMSVWGWWWAEIVTLTEHYADRQTFDQSW